MIDFLIAHWCELTYIILTLVCLIVTLVKKTKVVSEDTVFEQLLVVLPKMIIGAEVTGLKGQEKKDIVLNVAIDWLVKLTGKTRVEIADLYLKRIEIAIEDILSTPKKKEVL